MLTMALTADAVAQAFRRRLCLAVTGTGFAVSFFFPDSGSNRLVCRRSAAAFRLGFAAAVSCARLRLSAAIRPSTGGADLFRLDRQAFHLCLDQLAQRFLVPVPEGGRIEAAAAALDDRPGDRHHVGVDFRVAFFESGRSDLLGCP